ncbi:MAG: hypothetical protein KDN19_21000 [Verrucomicrobiae bacterium]|nr:hypothetical protein [Verrucomicrobiae bacterium]
MKPTFSIFLISLSLSSPLMAQDTVVPDIDARRQSVTNLERHIEQRRERMGELVDDIKTLDRRVEERVDEIVETLQQYKDSEESRVRVAKLKADVMAALKRSIDYYGRNRDALKEQLRQANPNVPRENLEKDLAIFDERIEKRVAQITAIASTFTDEKELEKYEVTSTSDSSWSWGWFGGFDENIEISEAWKQNRRETRHTDSAREGVVNALQDSIDHLTQRNDYLAGKLKGSNLSDLEKELYQGEIERNRALIGQRGAQLEEFTTTPTPETESLSRNEAHEVEQLVQDSRADLREDFFAIFRKYAELNGERAEIKKLEDNLEARRVWLKDYDAKQAK